MHTKGAFLIFIVLVGLFALAPAKRIYVTLQADADATSAGQRIRNFAATVGSIRHEFPHFNSASMEVPDDFDIASLKADSRFSFVEEVPQGTAQVVPNDVDIGDQWMLPSIGMEEVWDLVHWNQTRLQNITLAICDSGFDFTHPDLDASRVIWQYDYYNRDNNAAEDNYHGTHVAGIAAATTNNAVGIAGIAYGVNFMIGKVLDASGNGYYDDFIKCMTDAVDKGANIVNLSLGVRSKNRKTGTFGDLTSKQGTSAYNPLEQALSYAAAQGVLVVVAAGNNYIDGNPLIYPGAYANSFTVANIQNDNTRSPSSTTNSFVDIAAPGTDIYSTVPALYDSYYSLTGTSMATPCVAGIAALMMAAKPGTTAQQVRELLQSTAIDLGTAGKDNEFGYGKINPVRAIKELLNEPPVISVETSYELVLNESFSLNVSCLATESFDFCLSLNVTDIPSFMNVTQLSDTELMVTATPADAGSVDVTFTAVDTFNTVTTIQVTFTTPAPPVTPPTPIETPSAGSPTGSLVSSASSLSYMTGLALLGVCLQF